MKTFKVNSSPGLLPLEGDRATVTWKGQVSPQMGLQYVTEEGAQRHQNQEGGSSHHSRHRLRWGR